jgi:ABC-type antimicrobial peptide transport system permease subunit
LTDGGRALFYIRYLAAELRRRPGRTALTTLGLAVGVGLVVIVGALSRGLDDAQSDVLEPLTGVGTDLAVSRPIAVPEDVGSAGGSGGPDFSQLSPEEQRLLQRENRRQEQSIDYSELGEPGERFTRVSLYSTLLSLPATEVAAIRELGGVDDAAGSLTVNAQTIEGDVPASGAEPVVSHADGGFDFSSQIVTGVEVQKSELALVTPDQISAGRYLAASPKRARREAVIDLGYARQNDIGVGDETEIAGEEFEVVGLASAPLGGEASNAYLELGRLQKLAEREGRVNAIQARAESSEAVPPLSAEIEQLIDVAEVVTAADLADRVGGSLDDAGDLSSKLGTALAIVALLAAFLIAALLTLSSVQKRIRELGTLKALGWRQILVVRQVTCESLVLGVLGGLLGAAVGVAAAAIISAIGPTLEASVEAQSGTSFGLGDVAAGTSEVALEAPVDPGLLVLAVALAILGGLLAGAAGGLRAARLRPAEALRSAE